MPFALRDYQEETLDAIVATAADGCRRQLVSLSTGLGKTVIFSELPRRLRLPPTDVTLVVAHREELLSQAAAKMQFANPSSRLGVEKASRHASSSADVIIASVQTLRGPRLDMFLRRFAGRIKLLVIDEAHRAPAPSYRALIEGILAARDDALLVGLTASPNRPDRVGLQEVFDRVVAHRSAQWGIEAGYLVPLRCFHVATETSLDGIHTVKGDYDPSELSARVDTPDRNALVLSAYLQHARGKKAIVFCASVAHARHITQLFAGEGVAAETADGKTQPAEREAIVRRFRAGETRVLVNCALYYEGFDVPDAEVVILARPTQSNIIFSQAIGRILRPLEEVAQALGVGSTAASRAAAIAESRKPYGTVLDLVDRASKHSLLSLPVLWGLPARFDPQGAPIVAVRGAYERLYQRAPAIAEAASTYTEIQTKLREVDLFTPVTLDAAAARCVTLTWRPLPGGGYRLSLPSELLALDRTGAPIADYRRAYHRELEVARRAGASEPQRVARDVLNVDESTVAYRNERIDVTPDALAQYEVTSVLNGAVRKLGVATSLLDAFTRAEAWVRNNRRASLSALQRHGGWRAQPITAGQSDHLRSLGVPPALIPITKGEASDLIGTLRDRRERAG